MIGNAVNQSPGKFNLRTTLVVPFVLQIVAAVSLVGYLSLRSGQQSVNDLVSKLQVNVAQRVEQHIQSYLESLQFLNRIHAANVSSGELNPDDFSKLQPYFLNQLKIQEQTNYFIYVNPQGDFLGVLRKDSDSFQLKVRDRSSDPNRITYKLSQEGKVGDVIESEPYEARDRPFYTSAVAAGKTTWSPIFISFSRKVLRMDALTPLYAKTGELKGVFSTEVTLGQISEFLKQLDISPSGKVFILERSGNIVASSTNELPFVKTNEGEKRLQAVESKEPIIQETSKQILTQFQNFDRIQTPQHLDFDLRSRRQLVYVRPYKDQWGLDLLMVIVVPESDFMGQINANTRNSILLSLAALGVAIALGIYTSRWVTRPILRVSQASNQLAQGNLNQHVEPSPIIEIDTLANSFNGMADQLKTSFTALRQSEATNRAIVTTIPDQLIRVKGDGNYIDFVGSNHLNNAHELQQFSPSRNIEDVISPDLAKLRMQKIQQALQTGKLQVYEHQIKVNGHSRDEEVRIMVLGEDEVLVMVRDITDRKQAEEALRFAEENYRSIFENALEGIFQSSSEGRFISVNPALAKIYGYDSPTEMIESITNIGEQLYVEPEKRSEFKYLLETQGKAKNFQYRCYCKDGSIIWTEIDARAVKDSSGKLLYYEGIVQDISERKRREDELRKQLEELKIEIDHSKREKEVAMLTESSYFQEVQQEMAEVNLDEFWS